MERETNWSELLTYIDPARLSYQQWLEVGMGLHEAGASPQDWEDWSRRDPERYRQGECLRKWNTFHRTDTPITGGTIVKMAMEGGWRPSPGQELSWEDPIGSVVDLNWLEGQEVQPPSDWDPVKQLIIYLETLFEAGENVGYVTQTWEQEGKFLPTRGCWDRTAGELIQALSRCGGDLGAVLGDCDPRAGAWIRFNPLDGRGCKNENVTDFRYALVESDSMPVEEQNALLRELELPIAALVHSGGKSLHAIVRVEADSYEEYRKRVDFLYEVCRKYGLDVDRQNRNPSRLSRMPGVERNGARQFLADTNLGKASWSEWRDWIDGINDDLPDPEGDLDTGLPQLAPSLIENVLRQGHKMLLAGPSKAGKSFALIELAVCIAEGLPWLGFPCAQGKVMYVNLELDRASCLHRFRDVRQAMGAPARNSVDIWNLRGKSVPMDQLAPKLIRRASKKNYIAVIIDPIYKIITGDENSADQMARFCNQFDKVCTELGCAVIYCHHHSKGRQGDKRSMDRVSGSGVFARDPDALLDMIELPVSEELRRQELNNAVCAACAAALERAGKLEEAGQDDLCSERAALEACESVLGEQEYRDMLAAVQESRRAAEASTAWRIEGTLREFPRFQPVNVWFRYPIHRPDSSGVLADIDPEGQEPAWKKAADKRRESAKKARRSKAQEFEDAVANCNMGEPPTLNDLVEWFSAAGKEVALRTVRDWVAKFGYYVDKNDGGIRKKIDEAD